MFKTTKINVAPGETTNNETTTGYEDMKSLVRFPKLIELIFSFFFSFKKFYLWNIAVIAHFIIQLTVFIDIMNLTDYEATNNIIVGFLGITGGRFILCVIAFLAIRICFELVLVILWIHNQLSTIAESLERIEKEVK